MKNFIIIIAVLTAVLSGCGTAKNMNLNAYHEKGTAVSINEDKAYEMAVNNALVKITKAHSITVKANEQQEYANKETSHGRSAEMLNYKSNSSTRAVANITDYRVVSEKYTTNPFSKKVKCKVVVEVPFENVE